MALTRRRRRTKPNSPSPSAASSSVSSPAASSSASFPASSSSTSTIVVHQNQPAFNAYFSQIRPDGFYNSTTISNKDLRKYLELSAPQFAAFQTAIKSTFTQHPELLKYNLHQKEGRIKFADNLKKFLSLPDNVVAALKAVEQNGNVRKAAYAAYQTAVRLKRGKKTAGAKVGCVFVGMFAC
jgi:hypothetical protein